MITAYNHIIISFDYTIIGYDLPFRIGIIIFVCRGK